ncbi:MAG: HD domain-containing protein [Candidatus Micrarchaeia archaeon]
MAPFYPHRHAKLCYIPRQLRAEVEGQMGGIEKLNEGSRHADYEKLSADGRRLLDRWSGHVLGWDEHSMRMALVAHKLAQEHRMPFGFYGALLHDKGKEIVPPSMSWRKLSVNEIKQVQQKHHRWGYDAIAKTNEYDEHPVLKAYIAAYRGSHHWRGNGEGYGISREEFLKDFPHMEKHYRKVEDAFLKLGIIDYFDAAMTRETTPIEGKTESIPERLYSSYPGHKRFIDSLLHAALHSDLFKKLYPSDKITELRKSVERPKPKK